MDDSMLIGGGEPQRMKINPDDCSDLTCECGSTLFDSATKFKIVNKLMLGAQRDGLVPIPVLVCKKCGKEVSMDEYVMCVGGGM